MESYNSTTWVSFVDFFGEKAKEISKMKYKSKDLASDFKENEIVNIDPKYIPKHYDGLLKYLYFQFLYTTYNEEQVFELKTKKRKAGELTSHYIRTPDPFTSYNLKEIEEMLNSSTSSSEPNVEPEPKNNKVMATIRINSIAPLIVRASSLELPLEAISKMSDNKKTDIKNKIQWFRTARPQRRESHPYTSIFS